MAINYLSFLERAVNEGASDLHLSPGYPPMMRLHGEMVPMATELSEAKPLEDWLFDISPNNCVEQFQATKNTDYSWTASLAGETQRFRVNLYYTSNEVGACFRIIPTEIPTFEWAGFPQDIAKKLVSFRNGLILLSGVAGSGKTTTLAMLINKINEDGGKRIITIEEPVEYIFPPKERSFITQREVGVDVMSFADGLKYGLRQDPDVILVGEIRDRETAQMALSAAETGHLVFSTLHTRDAKGAISRFSDLFPQNVQQEVRSLLALSLRAVISQHLLPTVESESKRALALEVLFNNTPISSAIRFGKLETIDNNILTGRADGMMPLGESVRVLVQQRIVSEAVGKKYLQ